MLYSLFGVCQCGFSPILNPAVRLNVVGSLESSDSHSFRATFDVGYPQDLRCHGSRQRQTNMSFFSKDFILSFAPRPPRVQLDGMAYSELHRYFFCFHEELFWRAARRRLFDIVRYYIFFFRVFRISDTEEINFVI